MTTFQRVYHEILEMLLVQIWRIMDISSTDLRCLEWFMLSIYLGLWMIKITSHDSIHFFVLLAK